MSDQTGFRRFGPRGLVLVLGVALAGVAVPASPASAAVPGLMRMTATSASSSFNYQSVTAVCPIGKVLVGTGYEILGGNGEVTVDDFRMNGGPTTAPTAVTVGAYEVDEYAENWTVKAYAVCADPIAGLVRVAATTPDDSTDFNTVTATCPVGKVLTGSGFEFREVVGKGIVDDLRPNGTLASAPTAVTLGAYEADPFYGDWTATVYAVCADPIPGLVQATAISVPASTDFTNVVAVCPPGKVLLGGGFELRDAFGEVVVDDFAPGGGPATAPVSVITGAFEEDPYDEDWTIRSFGICASL
ncbi:hypothetical protein [Micromonospora sagamiensis]|uniref:Uncharacterized protein n=1 Tax=Micromonospora sagamiensis TaxID=47875 RepID=A0A562WLH8_9ACTN|nr:hypothetical protein [Micromonospora sagamiensis]TWJ31048.1 hypothetical protein JD81_04600 [Micromonospora sagamiensis]BCL15910.1 hypothetical protein GCM10017556_36490 [Micromonospora sagamiensis]